MFLIAVLIAVIMYSCSCLPLTLVLALPTFVFFFEEGHPFFSPFFAHFFQTFNTNLTFFGHFLNQILI